jgi:hypothetical protein
VFLLLLAPAPLRAQGDAPPLPELSPNPTGILRTLSTNGPLDTTNPFFQNLGSNQRACVTCHQPANAWSITPEHARARFDATEGFDPLFRTNDGSDCPTSDVSTLAARRTAYSLLLSKGLIRVGLALPANAEFELADVDDPYHYASARQLSLFRRPLPSTNLRFLSAVMWDGRETARPITGPVVDSGPALHAGLSQQALNATTGHAQATGTLTGEQVKQIVAFEMGLYTAQVVDTAAGPLGERGGLGGPQLLAEQEFYIGINDPLGLNPTGAAFEPRAFRLFERWESLSTDGWQPYSTARRAVARGEKLFNTKKFTITGVGGLNDALGQASLEVTCTTCHDTPGVGNHSIAVPLNIGISDASRRTADLPLYTLRQTTTGELKQTTDPGRALITGKWADIGKFKGPILRGLSARAPYFHNGSAATLGEVVEFYDERFQIQLTAAEKADLVAFLRSL